MNPECHSLPAPTIPGNFFFRSPEKLICVDTIAVFTTNPSIFPSNFNYIFIFPSFFLSFLMEKLKTPMLIILSSIENVSFADVEKVSLAKIPKVYHLGRNLRTNLAHTRRVPM